jgi:hypothetical protein
VLDRSLSPAAASASAQRSPATRRNSARARGAAPLTARKPYQCEPRAFPNASEQPHAIAASKYARPVARLSPRRQANSRLRRTQPPKPPNMEGDTEAFAARCPSEAACAVRGLGDRVLRALRGDAEAPDDVRPCGQLRRDPAASAGLPRSVGIPCQRTVRSEPVTGAEGSSLSQR